MKFEYQVCAVDLSKKLKKLGVKQDSLFYFARRGIYVPGFSADEEQQYKIILYKNYNKLDKRSYSAFTVAELGEILPFELLTENFYEETLSMGLHFEVDFQKTWSVSYYEKSEEKLRCVDKNEANARAKMIIYLIEKKLVDDEWREKWLVKS